MQFTLCLRIGIAAAGLGAAAVGDPSTGNWQLNAAKSKRAEGAPKTLAVEELEGDWVRVTAVSAGPEGKERRLTYRLKRDGQDYPVAGAPDYDAVSSLRIDAQSFETVYKSGGREVRRCRVRVAPDGRSSECRCVTVDAKGRKSASILAWDLRGAE